MSEDGHVRNDVSLFIESTEPMIDYEEHQLDRLVADDSLIASIIYLIKQEDDISICLVTSDDGLLMTAKAKKHNIRVIKLDDDYKIPPVKSDEERELLRVKDELERVKSLQPSLFLTWVNNEKHVTMAINRKKEFDEVELKSALNELKNDYQPIPKPAEIKEIPKDMTIREVLDSKIYLNSMEERFISGPR